VLRRRRLTVNAAQALWYSVFLVALGPCLSCYHRSYPSFPRTALGGRELQLAARIDSVVARDMRGRNIPGLSLAVLRHDSLILLRGYGLADREGGVSVTPETIFQIASLTKPFTAMAVMALIEDGRIQLDAPAGRYLDWLPGAYSAVTVRQLLHHTSGVPPDMRRANIDEMSEAEFRQRFAERAPSFPPGTSWQYANAGYTLLSQIVERASGESFGNFLDQRIFAPLGMRNTSYRVPERSDRQHAVGYDIIDGVLQRAPHIFSGWGNSGIETTAADLARWVAAIARGELLSESSYRLMFSPGRLAADTAIKFPFRDGRASYGFGWFLMQYRGDPLISHGGAIAGFSSVVNLLPTRAWSVVVLSNGKQGADRQGQAEALGNAVLDVLEAEQ
jgi:D-alanyl-D-alanine carboxypeptidase